MSLTNANAASQWAALDAQFKAGTLDQDGLSTALAALLDAWAPSNATLANLITSLSADVTATLQDLQALAILGTVATVGDLPTGASGGNAYLVAANGHGYAWINNAWTDIGQWQGPAGVDAAQEIGLGIPPGPFGSGERIGFHRMTRAFTVDTTLMANGWWLNTAPAGTAVFKIQRNGADWMTATFAAGAEQPTVTVASTTLAAGDLLTVFAPATADAHAADLAISIPGA